MSSFVHSDKAHWSFAAAISAPSDCEDGIRSSFSHKGDGLLSSVVSLVSSSYLLEDAVVIIPHVMLLSAYFILWAREHTLRTLHSRAKNFLARNGSNANGDIPTKYRCGFYFRATLFCCIYLFLASIFTATWSLYTKLRKNGDACLPFHAIAAAFVQVLAWTVMIKSVMETKRKGRLIFPCILRSWWIVEFLLLIYSSAFYVQILSRHSHNSLVFVWVSVTSCPAAAFLFIAAIFGNTGIRSVKLELLQPLLPHSPEESVEADVTPYSDAGFLSIATLSWLNPLLSLGARKPLELKDIPLLSPNDRIETSYLRLKAAVKHLKFEDPA